MREPRNNNIVINLTEEEWEILDQLQRGMDKSYDEIIGHALRVCDGLSRWIELNEKKPERGISSYTSNDTPPTRSVDMQFIDILTEKDAGV